jgi:type II secretory pathway pseudopilin PulG
MRHRVLRRRLRALGSDERGFTLIESIIAITMIFSSLVALAYTTTRSLAYQDIARQRQGATGIADKVMEEVRGLAYDKITSGLLSTDLAGDANIVSCSGVYRFLSCTAGSTPGSGEVIVNNAGLTTTTPIVPHQSTTSPNTNPVVNNITYTWSTYVSRDDSTTTAPYRVTIIVTWAAGAKSSSKVVRIQSLFWSPIGCASTATHPFSAPCQPYFLGNGTVPNGSLSMAGAIQGISVSAASISLMGASATVQQEQIPSIQAAVHPVEGSITDSSGTSTAGGVNVTTNADGDPNTATGSYSRVRCGTEVTCSGGSLSSPSSGSTTLGMTIPTTSSGESDSATTATSSNACPPSIVTSTGETDSLACSGSGVQQPSTIMATAHLQGTTVNVGDANLMRVGAQVNNQATAFVDRTTNPAPAGAGCTPAASTDGCIASSASRTYGNIRIGGFPEGMTPPLSSGNCSAAGDFYLVNLIGYGGSATAAAGYGSPLPTGNAPTGTLWYYNPTNSTCTSLAASSSSIGGLDSHYTTTQNVNGTAVTVSIATVTSQTTAASQSTSATPSTGGSATRTYATAQCVAPTLTVHYTITVPGSTIMDVTLVANLGTLSVDATYTPAPTGA